MMKHKAIYQRFLLLAALPAFMLASCTQEEMGGGPDAQNGEIRFEIGFAPQNEAMQTDAQTRVATDTKFNSTWEKGDEIGIYAVKHGEQLANSGNFIHNVKLTYTDGIWTASKDIYWPQDGTKYDFYAYYPYAATATDPTSIAFNVHTDQSATTGVKSNYNLSDLLKAKNDNSGKGYGKGETVLLSFTHALAMVEVNVSKSMIGDYPADMLKVELNGCSTDCKLNLSTQSATLPANSASPAKIKMYPCPNDNTPGIYAYRALVPAQELAKGTVLFSFEYDGSTLLRSDPLAKPLSLVQGGAEKFDITFPFTTVVATANVTSQTRLDNLFSEKELAEITHLKVMGEMTQADFYTIRDKMNNITNLDLSGSRVVGAVNIGSNIVQGNAIPTEALEYKTSLKEFVFPSGITSIGGFAFYDCSNLTGPLNIPEGVTTIGAYAFKNCSSITGTLILPAHLTEIGGSAFSTCSNLTGPLNIPAGIQTIESNVFSNCSGITSLTIPAGITVIGSGAFYKCEKLTEITSLILDPNIVEHRNEIFDATPVDNITLYVPAGKVASYQALQPWNSFKTIKELPAQKTKNE